MEHNKSDWQPDEPTREKLLQVQQILNELHDSGAIVGFSWIAGISPTAEDVEDHLTYNACCAAHMVDFLSPEITLDSPVDAIRVQARREFAKAVQKLAESPYAVFRDTYVPPSTN